MYVYNAIKENALDLFECTIEVNGTRWISVLHSSGSVFTIYNKGSFYSAYRTVMDNGEEFSASADPEGVQEVSQYIGRIGVWAQDVREFIETPDLWAEMANNREFVVEIQETDTSNTPFTKDEQSKIEAQLRETAKQLKEQFKLTNEQMERIEEWRDEVVEASARMGRKDWFIYLLGTVTALTISATVPAGVGEHILTMVIHTLGHLFTGGNEPPQIPPR